MTTETIGVLETVVGGRAHLVGWSDGGIVALLVALRRPDLVGKLVAHRRQLPLRRSRAHLAGPGLADRGHDRPGLRRAVDPTAWTTSPWCWGRR